MLESRRIESWQSAGAAYAAAGPGKVLLGKNAAGAIYSLETVERI